MSECPCGSGEITFAGYYTYGNADQKIVVAECTCGGQWISNITRNKFLGKCEENSCDKDSGWRPSKFCRMGGACDLAGRAGGDPCAKWTEYLNGRLERNAKSSS